MFGLSSGQLAAIGRHVVSYAAGAITAAAAMHFLSAGDANTLTTSLAHISDGVAEIAAGVAPIIALVSSWYAAWSASHPKQLAAVKSAVASGALPGVTVIDQSKPA